MPLSDGVRLCLPLHALPTCTCARWSPAWCRMSAARSWRRAPTVLIGGLPATYKRHAPASGRRTPSSWARPGLIGACRRHGWATAPRMAAASCWAASRSSSTSRRTGSPRPVSGREASRVGVQQARATGHRVAKGKMRGVLRQCAVGVGAIQRPWPKVCEPRCKRPLRRIAQASWTWPKRSTATPCSGRRGSRTRSISWACCATSASAARKASA
ncbi:hypothetical protein RLIN73S_02200 [Rhodanobacter lindaniclasticus]